MPVRQSWVECVLASGGYGSSSFQWHLILLAAPWATGASRSRSRSCSSVQHAAVSYASLDQLWTRAHVAYSSTRRFSRSCSISRFLERLYTRDDLRHSRLLRLPIQSLQQHVHRHSTRLYH